ncbi:hypothetical protein ACFQU7_08585 [Pseudoroseomonas wenyumeiae]
MLRWLLRRVGQIIPTLLILSVLIFALQQLMPGDPAVIMAGRSAATRRSWPRSGPS